MVISVDRMYYIFRQQTCTSAWNHVVYICSFMHAGVNDGSSSDVSDCELRVSDCALRRAFMTVEIRVSLLPRTLISQSRKTFSTLA